MDSDAVDKRYKAKLMPRVLEYYVIHDMEEELERYLKKTDVSWLDKNARKYVFSLLMERKLFEEAYDLLISCGSELADPSKLVVLCSHMIETGDHEEDEVLVGLGMEALRAGKYNDVLLRYLCRYYHGPTRQMYELWETAKKYEINDTGVRGVDPGADALFDRVCGTRIRSLPAVCEKRRRPHGAACIF